MFKYKITNFNIKLFIILNILFSSLAYANSSNQFIDDMVEVKLISTINGINNKNPFYIGLEFNLNPEWKIYWRSPGDSGSPPLLDLSNSKNLQSYKMKWPVPVRINETEDIITNVYFDKVVFPISVVVEDINEPLFLDGKLSFQVCKTICIPIETNLYLTIKNGYSFDDNYTHIMEKALSKVPVSIEEAGITNITLHQISKNILRLSLKSKIDLPKGKLNIFLERKEGENIKIDKIKNIKTGNKNSAIFELFINKNQLNIIKGDMNLDVTFSLGELAVFKKANMFFKKEHSLSIIVLISLLGGFILNFMPCVLPVLSLKVTRFISVDTSSKQVIKHNFFYTVLGIVFSFLVLACISIILKLLGNTIGWGIQFQQPYFISFLIIIILIFSANLFGLFSISPPSLMYTKIDQYIRYKEKGKSFFEGAFATLLATPCSAPFLGTALGYAMSSNVFVILIIFTLLGLGMSLPYLIFYIYPNLILNLPKPGKWMKKLNFLLGLGLAGTAIWLIGVLLKLSNWTHVFLIFLIAMIVVFIFANKSILKTFVFSLSMFIAIIYMNFKDINNLLLHLEEQNEHDSDWIKFEERKIQNLVDEGNIVFVDITADWCVTCKLNKVLVLENKNINNYFKDENIILMRGDWTKPDEQISSFLFSWGRYGIPLNIIYGPNAKNGILLPEILTINLIQKSIIESQ